MRVDVTVTSMRYLFVFGNSGSFPADAVIHPKRGIRFIMNQLSFPYRTISSTALAINFQVSFKANLRRTISRKTTEL